MRVVWNRQKPLMFRWSGMCIHRRGRRNRVNSRHRCQQKYLNTDFSQTVGKCKSFARGKSFPSPTFPTLPPHRVVRRPYASILAGTRETPFAPGAWGCNPPAARARMTGGGAMMLRWLHYRDECFGGRFAADSEANGHESTRNTGGSKQCSKVVPSIGGGLSRGRRA